MCIRYLALWGATVVRVENHTRLDMPRVFLPFKDGIPGINRSAMFANVNNSVLGVTINLNKPAGLDIAWKLIKWADVMSESGAPGAMAKWGVYDESVSRVLSDIVYFGADAKTVEALNDRLGTRGVINIVTGGRKIGRAVSVGVGRVHYGMTRWIGTTDDDASVSYRNIPRTGEVRPGDRVVVIGGPKARVIGEVTVGADRPRPRRITQRPELIAAVEAVRAMLPA